MLNSAYLVANQAEVAGAIGAAIGSFSFSGMVTIARIEEEDIYRAYLPQGLRDFEDLETAICESTNVISEWLIFRAKDAGYTNSTVEIKEENILGLWTELHYQVKAQ